MGILGSFKKDIFNKELIPVKVLMFLIYGGQATLYPYFTVHLKDLGVSIQQTSVIFAVQPIIALLVAPMVGMLADRIGNFKYIFSFFLLFSATTANLLLLVPPVDFNIVSFNITCDSTRDSGEAYISSHQPGFSDSCSSTTNISLYSELISCVLISGDTTEYTNQTRSDIYLGYDGPQKRLNVLDFFEIFVDVNTTETESGSVEYFKVSSVSRGEDTYRTFFCNRTSDTSVLQSCSVISQVSRETCPTQPFFGKTFYTYLSIRLVATLGIGLVNGLFDAASMAIVQELKADVGYQRFWATVGMCIFAPLSGHLVDTFGNFKPCFFMYGVMYIIAALTSLLLDLSMKLPSENSFSNLAQLLSNLEVVLMLLHVGILGICWGFLENFLFWFLENELHSSNLLMGLTVTVGSGTGLFMALVSTWCTRKLGYVNVMVLAFAAYTVRYIGYSYAQDAYVCLVYEMMENFTVTLLTVGVTLYCAELASMKMLTTMMTLWNGLHVISGRAFGSLIGGFLMSRVGARRTFRAFAVGSCIFGTFYFFVNIFWLRRKKQRTSGDDDSSRKRSTFSNESEMEYALNQTVMTLHCSQDSPSLIAYISDPHLHVAPRRRALSHVLSSSNSFKSVRVPPRLTQSFRLAAPPFSLATVQEEVNGDFVPEVENGSVNTRF